MDVSANWFLLVLASGRPAGGVEAHDYQMKGMYNEQITRKRHPFDSGSCCVVALLVVFQDGAFA